jgi:hypothetical protein
LNWLPFFGILALALTASSKDAKLLSLIANDQITEELTLLNTQNYPLEFCNQPFPPGIPTYIHSENHQPQIGLDISETYKSVEGGEYRKLMEFCKRSISD